MTRRRTESRPSDGGTIPAKLQRAHDLIDDLSVSDGGFEVTCKETGVSPEPVTDARFGSYEAAERACEAARRYREALGELDRSLTQYDLVAAERFGDSLECTTVRESTDRRRANGLPRTRRTATMAGGRSDEWLRIENCPVVHLTGPESLLDDEFVSRQLRSSLRPRDTLRE